MDNLGQQIKSSGGAHILLKNIKKTSSTKDKQKKRFFLGILTMRANDKAWRCKKGWLNCEVFLVVQLSKCLRKYGNFVKCKNEHKSAIKCGNQKQKHAESQTLPSNKCVGDFR